MLKSYSNFSLFYIRQVMADISAKPVNEEDLQSLKDRMKVISEADPSQYHNDFSLRRYLRAFKTVDAAFQVYFSPNTCFYI